MKKIISNIIVVAVLLSLLAFGAVAEENVCDPMNNELFDVIAEITDVEESGDVDHGKVVKSEIRADNPGATLTKIYEDGARVKTKVFGENFYGQFSKATEDFPAYLEEADENKFIFTETGFADFDSFTWHYLVEIGDEDPYDNLICTVYTQAKENGSETTITYYSKDENGNEVERVEDGCPLSGEEYNARFFVNEFDDGLIYKSSYDYEGIISGYYNAQDEMVFLNPQFSYYDFYYNLGYFVEIYNNAGEIDWANENAVDMMEYFTSITNSVNGKKYDFKYTEIPELLDNGYALMEVGRAGEENKTYLIKLKTPAIPTVHLNGEKIKFDQIPVIENGRTLVPLRAIFEALGAEVAWDGETSTVTATKDGIEVKLTIDSTEAYRNGEKIELDVPAKLMNGRTLVPVRFIADSFGVKVEWVEQDCKVVLSDK